MPIAAAEGFKIHFKGEKLTISRYSPIKEVSVLGNLDSFYSHHPHYVSSVKSMNRCKFHNMSCKQSGV